MKVDKALVERVLDDLQQRSYASPRTERSSVFEPGHSQIVWSTLWKRSGGVGSELYVGELHDSAARSAPKDFTSEDWMRRTRSDPAVLGHLALPRPTDGAKSSLTVKDLTSLLQTSDFLPTGFGYRSGGDPWPASVAENRRAEQSFETSLDC